MNKNSIFRAEISEGGFRCDSFGNRMPFSVPLYGRQARRAIRDVAYRFSVRSQLCVTVFHSMARSRQCSVIAWVKSGLTSLAR